MPLRKLLIDIPQEGYSVRDPDSVLRAKVSAGASRQRLDQLGAPLEADVSMVLSPLQFDYWRAFYRTAIGEGALPFLLGVVVDSAAVVDHEVKIIPGTLSTNIRGTAHAVQFQIEVKKQPPPIEGDDLTFLELFMTYGENLGVVIEMVEQLANFEFPSGVP